MTGPTRVALRLEPLSDRLTPAVTVAQDGGVLTITGDQRANDIEITDGPGGLTVTADGTGYPVTGTVDTVRVYGRAGDDTVSYSLAGDLAGVTRTVEVFLGNGKDTFAGDLGFAIDAASDLTLRVDGGNGKDVLGVTGSGSVDGGLTVELKGGNGMDELSFDFTGALNGTLAATADGGNGKDSVRGTVTAATGSAGAVTANVVGGNGMDDLALSVTVGTLTTDLTIDGGRGKDAITATDNVTVVDVGPGKK